MKKADLERFSVVFTYDLDDASLEGGRSEENKKVFLKLKGEEEEID
jgi:hypothetical protein